MNQIEALSYERATLRRCRKCNENKPLIDFHRQKRSSDGYNPLCKCCYYCVDSLETQRLRAAEWRRKNPDKIQRYNKDATKRRRERDWAAYLIDKCRTVRLTHKRNGRILDYDLTKEFLIRLFLKQGGRCYWTGCQLYTEGKIHRHPRLISIDRIDSSRGYTQDNCVLSSFAANTAKNDHSQEMFVEFLKDIGVINAPCMTPSGGTSGQKH